MLIQINKKRFVAALATFKRGKGLKPPKGRHFIIYAGHEITNRGEILHGEMSMRDAIKKLGSYVMSDDAFRILIKEGEYSNETVYIFTSPGDLEELEAIPEKKWTKS